MTEGKPLYAAVMLKGTVTVDRQIVDTLKNLRLSTVNNCIIVPADGTYSGMLKRVATHVTWGEVTQETLEKLLEKKGDVDGKKAKSLAVKAFKDNAPDVSELKPVFKLSPPSGGLKSVRIHYPRGDMGYRGEEINRLLLRMI